MDTFSIHSWLVGVLRGDEAELAAVSAVVLGLFSFVLRALLPQAQRARVRLPLALLIGQLGVSVAADLLAVHSPTRRYLGIGALFLLLLAIGRLSTLFFVDFLFGRRRAPSRIVRDIIQGVFVVVAVLITLRRSGVDAASLLTTSALLTAIVGLSLQDTLGNLIAGLSLQLQQPFSVGEWLQLDHDGFQVGEVVEINWRATRLRTVDDAELIVPNAQMARASLLNYSRPNGEMRRSITVTVPCEVPPHRVHEIVSKAIAKLPGVRSEPAPTVTTHDFRDLGVQYVVRYYIEKFREREAIDGAVRDRVWYALARADVMLSTNAPQRPERSTRLVNEPGAPSAAEPDAAERAELDARVTTIRGIDFLQDLPAGAIEMLARGARTETYQPGEIVVRQGEIGGELYLCLSGELVVVHTPPQGRARELARLHHGSMFGELALMTGEPRTATVQAVATCELAVIAKDAFAQVLGQNPGFADVISDRMAERQASIEEADHAPSADHRVSIAEHKQRFLRGLREFFSL